jgi:hypothetical protein
MDILGCEFILLNVPTPAIWFAVPRMTTMPFLPLEILLTNDTVPKIGFLIEVYFIFSLGHFAHLRRLVMSRYDTGGGSHRPQIVSFFNYPRGSFLVTQPVPHKEERRAENNSRRKDNYRGPVYQFFQVMNVRSHI